MNPDAWNLIPAKKKDRKKNAHEWRQCYITISSSPTRHRSRVHLSEAVACGTSFLTISDGKKKKKKLKRRLFRMMCFDKRNG